LVTITVDFSHNGNANDKLENLLKVGFAASVDSAVLAK
jgi:hypothetical protein